MRHCTKCLMPETAESLTFDAEGVCSVCRQIEFKQTAIDWKAKGTEFDGIDGLRNYLLTKKKDVVTRLFCRRLLGYALGRSVTLSDTSLLDEMVAELNKNEGGISSAVQAIVRSPQFRMVRGSESGE